jgi:hypothetical protein
VPCYTLSVVPMYHLNGDTVCYVQRLDTIMTVGDAVQANLPTSVQHRHMLLSSRVPVSMLSKRLADVVKLPQPQLRAQINTDRSERSESHSGQSCPVARICCNLPEQDYG